MHSAVNVAGTAAFCICLLLAVSTIGGCSSVGPGLLNHPIGCAFGVPWADCLPGIGGFRGSDPVQVAAEKSKTAVEECQQKRFAKEIIGFKAAAECATPKIVAAYQEVKFPHMDLIYVVTAARVVGAEKVDKRQITEAEYRLQLAELASRVTAEAQRRNLAQSSAQAAQLQAVDSLLTGLGGLQTAQAQNRPTPLQLPTALARQTIHCNSVALGGATSTTCN
jgi:hypothetical protein